MVLLVRMIEKLLIIRNLRRINPPLKRLDALRPALETWHKLPLRRIHHFDEHQNLALVLSDGFEAPGRVKNGKEDT